MSSAFPNFLKKADPFLRSEESNAVYQAFRLRRTEHHTARRFALTNFRPLGIPIGATLSIGIRMVFPLAIAYVTLLAMRASPPVFLGFIIGFLVSRFFYRRFSRYSGVLTIYTALHPERASRDLVQDVVLTGAGGRDILEAIYLERAELGWLRIPISLAIFFTIATYIQIRFGNILSLQSVYFYPALILFTWQASLSGLTSYRSLLRGQVLRPIRDFWRDAGFGQRTKIYGRFMLRALVMIGLVLGGMFLTVLCIGLSIVNQRRSESLNGLHRYVADNQIAIVASCLLIVTAIILAVSRPTLRRRTERAMDKLLDSADEAFDKYMRRDIVPDEHGEGQG